MAKPSLKGVRSHREAQRLHAQGEEIQSLAKFPGLKRVSSKRYDKLLRQLDKVDRAIVKIKKIASHSADRDKREK